MSVKITNIHNEQLYHAESVTDKGAGADEFRELSYSTSETFWQSEAKEISLTGTHIGFHKVNIRQPVFVKTSDLKPMPGLFFVEKGSFETKLFNSSDHWQFSSRQHNLLYNAYSAEVTRFEVQRDLHLFIISFTPERFKQIACGNGRLLEELANSIDAQKTFSLLQRRNLNISAEMYHAIQDIKFCAFAGSARKLYFESKSLELLALQMEQFESGSSIQNKISLTSTDNRKLEMVKEMLEADLSAEHSLASLAKTSGLNEFKLKKGFRQLYHQTVFGYLASLRLEHADRELRQSDKSLTQIAYETGYASLQHFSTAYKKRYGISPIQRRSPHH